MASHFDDEHHARMSEAIAARPARDGLDRNMIDSGDVITISRNKVNGDRSYIDCVWEVVATNGVQILLKVAEGSPRQPFTKDPVMLMLDEHEFYDGRTFLGRVTQSERSE